MNQAATIIKTIHVECRRRNPWGGETWVAWAGVGLDEVSARGNTRLEAVGHLVNGILRSRHLTLANSVGIDTNAGH